MMISPAIAGWLLQFRHNCPDLRKLDMDIVGDFYQKIFRGTFTADPPVDFMVRGGEIELKNGQHRLASIIEAGRAVNLNLRFSLDGRQDDGVPEAAVNFTYWRGRCL